MTRFKLGICAEIRIGSGLAAFALVTSAVLFAPSVCAATRGVPTGIDFGDAPDSYATTLAGNGARHVLDPQNSLLLLGSCADSEIDAVAPLDGTGDDLDSGVPLGSCDTGDDEEGVLFSGAPFVACQATQVGVTASAAGLLDAWIDWNQDGDFTDTGEAIATNQPMVAGLNSVAVTVPCSAVAGSSFARFRISTAGGLSPSGSATDGEVEDYAITFAEVDLGDAPDSYGTSFAANGPIHTISPGLFLGPCVDSEGDAQAPLDGTGDDLAAGTAVGTCNNNDDEDGIAFSLGAFIACEPSQIFVEASAAGRLDAWIDWNRDGDFADLGEAIAVNQAVGAGITPLTITSSCDAVSGATFARFRLSSAGGLAPTGPAADGEVEDYAVNLREVDQGDAPDSYGTTQASNGPTHAAGSGLYLGACADTEPSARTPLDATGDDGAAGVQTFGTCAVAGDDEDGVTIPPLIACEPADLRIVASATMRLDAWIDWNRDGDFNDFVPLDFNERIATRLVLTPGLNILTISVPCSAPSGLSYARFRVSSNGVNDSGGPAGEGAGEVEDYAVEISRRVVDVPALGPLGLGLLGALLAVGGLAALGRRKRVRLG